jgi:uncharacterized protein (DUF1810 family)
VDNAGADMPPASHDLQRFVDAQAPVYAQVLRELQDGQKRTHWMWFVFPQIRGLGHSAMAQRYAIESLDEARAYLAHPVLGPRLNECCRLVLDADARSIGAMFPYPDDLKLRSCMTLFAHASDENAVFRDVLDRYFTGRDDAATLDLLREG